MKAKAQEQNELLKHYEDKSYLYGRRAQDLQAHTDALIRHYEKGVKMNIKEAALHRQIASRPEEGNYAASGAQWHSRDRISPGCYRNKAVDNI